MPKNNGWTKAEAIEQKTKLLKNYSAFIASVSLVDFEPDSGWGFGIADAFGGSLYADARSIDRIVYQFDDWQEESAAEWAAFSKYELNRRI